MLVLPAADRTAHARSSVHQPAACICNAGAGTERYGGPHVQTTRLPYTGLGYLGFGMIPDRS